jgi:hypothetical protein
MYGGALPDKIDPGWGENIWLPPQDCSLPTYHIYIISMPDERVPSRDSRTCYGLIRLRSGGLLSVR